MRELVSDPNQFGSILKAIAVFGYLWCVSEKAIRIWDPETGKLIRDINGGGTGLTLVHHLEVWTNSLEKNILRTFTPDVRSSFKRRYVFSHFVFHSTFSSFNSKTVPLSLTCA